MTRFFTQTLLRQFVTLKQSAPQSKNAVCENTKHCRYFHYSTYFWSIHFHAMLYLHIVWHILPWKLRKSCIDRLLLVIFLGIFQGKRKWTYILRFTLWDGFGIKELWTKILFVYWSYSDSFVTGSGEIVEVDG